jgi:hypothetical protein
VAENHYLYSLYFPDISKSFAALRLLVGPVLILLGKRKENVPLDQSEIQQIKETIIFEKGESGRISAGSPFLRIGLFGTEILS